MGLICLNFLLAGSLLARFLSILCFVLINSIKFRIMSIRVENNLKDSENKELFEQRAHYMPCQIEEDGPANVGEYFEPYIVDKGDGELSATFRGHPMDGEKMPLPEGYRAVIVSEGKRPLSEDVERKFQVTGGFKEIIYWNWDKKPSKNDNLAKALVWMDIAEAIHSD